MHSEDLTMCEPAETPGAPTLVSNALVEKSTENPSNPMAITAALPPIDGGLKAWSFCFSACMLETLIFGWNDTIGTFQAYYVSHAPYNQSSTAAASAIGTSSQAIQYIEAAILVWVFQRYPRAVKPAMWAGLIVCTGTLLASSFTNRVWQLILTQGVFYGLAAGPLITPVYMWLPEWFVAKRGLAGGIIFGFSGVGGFVMPLIIGLALDRYGMNWTLRVWAIVFAVCAGLAVFGTRPRIPIQHTSPDSSDDDSSFPFLEKKYIIRLLSSPLMILMCAATFFQSIGYFPVSYYVSTYSLYIPGSSIVDSTITLGLLNISSAVTYAGFGKICDLYPYPRVILWSSLAATLSAALLWGFASKVAVLFVFATIYGGASNGFPGVWAAAATEIGESTDKGTSLAFGVLSFAKGIAVVIGPLIADALHGKDIRTLQKYGSFGFTNVIIYVASMSAATGLTAIPLLFLSQANRKRTPNE